MKQKQGYWHRSYDVDPILKILRLKGKEKEGFVFVIIKGFYSMMKHDLNKELLYLEFHEYHVEIDFLIKERYITITRNSKNPKVKIKSMQVHYTKTTQKEKPERTSPLNSSDTITRRQDKKRVEETRQEDKSGKTTPTDSTFSTYSECYKWAIKTFKTHTGNQLLFDQHLGKIFNTYKKQKWIDENGCTIANKKGIIIRAMQNKDWHTKSEV